MPFRARRSTRRRLLLGKHQFLTSRRNVCPSQRSSWLKAIAASTTATTEVRPRPATRIPPTVPAHSLHVLIRFAGRAWQTRTRAHVEHGRDLRRILHGSTHPLHPRCPSTLLQALVGRRRALAAEPPFICVMEAACLCQLRLNVGLLLNAGIATLGQFFDNVMTGKKGRPVRSEFRIVNTLVSPVPLSCARWGSISVRAHCVFIAALSALALAGCETFKPAAQLEDPATTGSTPTVQEPGDRKVLSV